MKGGNQMFKKTLLMFLLVTVLLFAYGCGEAEETVEVVTPVDIEDEELPKEIKAWIESSRDQFGGRARVHDGLLYILITYGEKPTGGYVVEIEEIKKQEETLVVTVEFTEPGEDEMVTQAITYPYDLAVVEETDLPVEFVATGDEDTVPVLD